ncbi:MAG TPA: hypothetical protein DGQ94_13685 [Pseudomonas sp.]|nr:hypothetical protein [Pseudomonas sp.]
MEDDLVLRLDFIVHGHDQGDTLRVVHRVQVTAAVMPRDARCVQQRQARAVQDNGKTLDGGAGRRSALNRHFIVKIGIVSVIQVPYLLTGQSDPQRLAHLFEGDLVA